MKRNNNTYKYIIYGIIIVLITIILIIPFLISPLLFQNIKGLIQPKKNSESLDVVISHYNEDLTWIDSMIPENARVFIYTKSDEKPNCKRHYIHKYLKNVGREGNTYLHHIIANYDNNTFNDNILFLPGSVDLFYKKLPTYLLLNNVGKMDFNSTFIIKNNKIFNYFANKQLDKLKKNGYESSYDSNKHSDDDIIVYKFNNMNDFMKYFHFKSDYFTYKGMFLIKKNLIYNRPKEFYVKLINYLNNGDNILNGHFLERSWYSVFNP